MKLHHLKPPEGSRQKKIRVGRGDRGRRGKTAGRGTKGTHARGKLPLWFEGGQLPLIRRQPKIGRSPRPSKSHPVPFGVINVGRLDEAFGDGDEVTPATLRAKGLVRKGRPVKVLGHGELSKRLVVAVDAISEGARQKVLAAGGTVAPAGGGRDERDVSGPSGEGSR